MMAGEIFAAAPAREGLALELRAKLPPVIGLRRARLVGHIPPAVVELLRLDGFVVDAIALGDAETSSPAAVDVILVEQQGDVAQVLDSLQSMADEVCIVDARADLKTWARIEWEQGFIEAGWRKHPCRERVSPYSTLDKAGGIQWSWFQRVPGAALQAYPLAALKEERDLHMDMTREWGRRSDAHLTRYALAAQFVRDGDAVLDLACGLGYGASVLDANAFPARIVGVDNSAYAVDYATLNFQSPDSRCTYRLGSAESIGDSGEVFDFVTSIETLEHLLDPEAWLGTLFDKLSPGGRLFVSVPLDWADETGEDPNPYHHHVYFWPTLRLQLETAGFVVERVWVQDAGGGFKRHEAERDIREVPYYSAEDAEGEWILALAMKPNKGGSGVSTAAESGVPNILAFERDYDDASVVRSVVSVGLRASSSRTLGVLALRVLDRSHQHSADYGAALCVLAYLELQDQGAAKEYARPDFETLIPGYVSQPSANATVYRWKVSLMYVLALLRHVQGRYLDALEAYSWVAERDASVFSPLLATKTMQALFRKGALQQALGRTHEARETWRSVLPAVRSVLDGCDWREVIGDEASPATFGLPELADVLDFASKSVHALRVMDMGGGDKSGISLDRVTSSSQDRMRRLTDQIGACNAHVGALELAVSWLEDQRQNWMTVGQQRDHLASESTDWMRAHIERLESELRAAHEAREELRQYIESRNSVIDTLVSQSSATQEGLAWLEAQREGLTEALESQRVVAADLQDQLSQQEEAHAWSEAQRIELLKEVERQTNLAATLQSGMRQSEESRQWLEAQRNALLNEVDGLNAIAADLRADLEAKRLGSEWQEQQRNGLLAELSASVDKVSSLNAMLDEHEAAIQWLDAQGIGLLNEMDARGQRVEELSKALEESSARVQSMGDELSRMQSEVTAHENIVRKLQRHWLGRMALRRAQGQEAGAPDRTTDGKHEEKA